MKRKNKWLKRIIIIAIILAIGAFAVYSMVNAKQTQYTQETVKTRDIETFYTFTGNIEPNKSETVYATYPSKVNKIYFLEGDLVKEEDNVLRAQSGTQYQAPIDGTVSDIYPEMNANIKAGDPLFRIATYENPVVIISVDEYDVHALHTGDQVTAYIQAMDKTVNGTIEKIDKEATVSGNVAYYKAKVAIDQDGSILMGMTCEVAAPKQSAKNVPTLPISCLYYDENNNPYILIRDRHDEVIAEYVTLGVTNGSIVEILDGVRTGDTVLTIKNQSSMFMAMPEGMGRSGR